MGVQRLINYILKFLIFAGSAMIVIGNVIVQDHIAVPHIGMAILAGCGLINIYLQGQIKLYLDKRIIISFCGMFLVYVAAMLIHHESWYFARHFLQNHAVIMIYPLVLALIPKQSYQFYTFLFYVYNVLFTIISIITLKNYINKVYIVKDIEFLQKEIIDRHLIPFEFWHHLFSLFLVTGILFMLYVIYKKYYLFGSYEKWLIIPLILFFLVMIHISGSRIGMGLSYLLFFAYLAFLYRKLPFYYYKKIAFSLIAGIFLLFTMLYITVPEFNKRIDSTAEDVSKVLKLDYNHTFSSIAGRIFSLKVGLKIIEKYPWKGVSFSNSSNFYFNYYVNNYTGVQKLRPHNQFIYLATKIGIPLGSIFVICLIFPLLILRKKANFLFIVFYGIHLVYMMGNYPFNTQEWFYTFSFLAPLCIHFLTTEKHPSSD